MIKKFVLVGVILVAIGFVSACEEGEKGEGGIFSMSMAGETEAHHWDLILNKTGGLVKYYIKVEKSGGSGEAVISVRKLSSRGEAHLPNQTVYEGTGIWIESFGPELIFNSIGGNFYLAYGDEWVAMVDSGRAIGVFVVNQTTSSATVKIEQYSGEPECDYGFFKGVPLVSVGGGFSLSALMGVEVEVGTYNLSGTIPEVHLLNFATTFPLSGFPPVVKAGDSLEVSYKYKFISDGEGGDFFILRLTNERNYSILKKIKRAEAGSSVHRFRADGSFIGLDFIFGLSSQNDLVVFDDFEFKVNGAPVFGDDFEVGSLKAGFPNFIWMESKPRLGVGSAGICSLAQQSISGANSYCVYGGRYFNLYGISAEQEGFSLVEFLLTDGSPVSFFSGAFLGMSQGGVNSGSYRGRNYDGSCVEGGSFFIDQDLRENILVSGSWDILMNAEQKDCNEPSQNGLFNPGVESMQFVQLNTSLGGLLNASTVSDGSGNKVQTSGFVRGNMVMVMLTTVVPLTKFYRLSLVGAPVSSSPFIVAGQVTGWVSPNLMRMDQTCTISGSFQAKISP